MIRSLFALCAASLIAAPAGASCITDGKRTQSVSMSVDGIKSERWEVTSGAIYRKRLPGGFELGLMVEEATPEKYREALSKSKGSDELVKISLFDMSATPPRLISTTWGGANSRQGFGPKGGANAADIGSQVELWFHKAVCVTADSLGAAK